MTESLLDSQGHKARWQQMSDTGDDLQPRWRTYRNPLPQKNCDLNFKNWSYGPINTQMSNFKSIYSSLETPISTTDLFVAVELGEMGLAVTSSLNTLA